jgi:hypothetical protein
MNIRTSSRSMIILMLFIASFFLSRNVFSQQNWVWQNPLPTGNTLTAVTFTDEKTGWAVGGYGTIIHTSDGITWEQQKSGTTKHLYAVSFTDANNGTAVGDYGTILRTTNGGINWMMQNDGWNRIFMGSPLLMLIQELQSDIAVQSFALLMVVRTG